MSFEIDGPGGGGTVVFEGSTLSRIDAQLLIWSEISLTQPPPSVLTILLLCYFRPIIFALLIRQILCTLILLLGMTKYKLLDIGELDIPLKTAS